MKLTIALLAAAAVLRFTLPGPGSYSLFSVDGYMMRVEASGYCSESNTVVTVTLPRVKYDAAQIFSVRFVPEAQPAGR